MKAITLASASAIDQRVTSTVLGPGIFWSAIFWDNKKSRRFFLLFKRCVEKNQLGSSVKIMVCLWDSLQKEGSKFQYHSIPKKSCPFHLHLPVFSLFWGIIPWMKIPHFFSPNPSIPPNQPRYCKGSSTQSSSHIRWSMYNTRRERNGQRRERTKAWRSIWPLGVFPVTFRRGNPRRIQQPGGWLDKTAAVEVCLLRKRRPISWGSEKQHKWQPTLWPTLKVDGSNGKLLDFGPPFEFPGCLPVTHQDVHTFSSRGIPFYAYTPEENHWHPGRGSHPRYTLVELLTKNIMVSSPPKLVHM